MSPAHRHTLSPTSLTSFPLPPPLPPQLALRFTPTSAKPASCKAICVFNNVASDGVPLMLRGAAHTPRLTFDVSGSLFFRSGRGGLGFSFVYWGGGLSLPFRSIRGGRAGRVWGVWSPPCSTGAQGPHSSSAVGRV